MNLNCKETLLYHTAFGKNLMVALSLLPDLLERQADHETRFIAALG